MKFDSNWDLIVTKSQHLIGKYFKREGKQFFFAGVLWGWDDYYYLMWNIEEKKYELSSCVGSLEIWGYELDKQQES